VQLLAFLYGLLRLLSELHILFLLFLNPLSKKGERILELLGIGVPILVLFDMFEVREV
jgi:hypothetical protein